MKSGSDREPPGTIIQRARRAVGIIQYKGLDWYVQNFCYKLLRDYFDAQKAKVRFGVPTWREINFKALEIEGSARILLNPSDGGFSKEFYVYGFREPLNTFAIFNSVKKDKPVVLDIGGNLGYFPFVELQAGAKQVIVLEPVPSTFELLSKTLSEYQQFIPFNVAISDGADHLKLYLTDERNVTSFSKAMLTANDHKISEELNAKALTLPEIADKYPISMIRMDIEGYEYNVLANILPDKIRKICVELHVIPPYDKAQAVALLKKLQKQGFKVSTAIDEMIYAYYPIIQHSGLETAYKLVTAFNNLSQYCPRVAVNPSAKELNDIIPEKGQVHLILER